jgi:PKD repeat protein
VTFGTADFPVVAPTVSRFMSSPNNPGVNQDVFFNGSASTATNATYAWDFGDGSRGSGVSATHQYSQPGTFTVLLTVTSENGQSNTSSRTIAVSANLPPTAAVFTFSPTQPAVNQDVVFATTTIVSGVRFTWEFGDGATASGAPTTHRYSRAGTYTITLRVTNDIGQAATSARTLTVSSTSPQVVARFTFSPTTPAINEDVFFNASSSTVDNGTFAWDFGDGLSGSGVTPRHQYARGGTYTVTLTVTNDLGQTSTMAGTITVSATSTQVVASFTFSPTTPGINEDVFFNASASTPINGSFIWDFGDGSRGSGVTSTHRYSQAATYTVTLTDTNSIGQSSTTTRAIPVSATSTQVVASFTFSPTTPGTNQDVFFNASTSTPSSGTFAWDFGDGSRGSGATPTHQYLQAATYTVTLTVTNTIGQSATTSKTITVSPNSMVADFAFSPTDPTISSGTNVNVIFDATPSSPGVTTWTWDFGDGTAAGAGQKTTHTFLKAGTWIVRLTVTDSAGRTATTTKSVKVI